MNQEARGCKRTLKGHLLSMSSAASYIPKALFMPFLYKLLS